MSGEAAPHLTFIARQVLQLINDVGTLKDDLTVLTAIATRQDATFSGLPTEVRAMHSQHNRLAYRVRELETSGTGNLT